MQKFSRKTIDIYICDLPDHFFAKVYIIFLFLSSVLKIIEIEINSSRIQMCKYPQHV